jgi:hypothetical protein
MKEWKDYRSGVFRAVIEEDTEVTRRNYWEFGEKSVSAESSVEKGQSAISFCG